MCSQLRACGKATGHENFHKKRTRAAAAKCVIVAIGRILLFNLRLTCYTASKILQNAAGKVSEEMVIAWSEIVRRTSPMVGRLTAPWKLTVHSKRSKKLLIGEIFRSKGKIITRMSQQSGSRRRNTIDNDRQNNEPPGVRIGGGAGRGGGGRLGPALGRGGGFVPGLREGDAGASAFKESANVSASTSSLRKKKNGRKERWMRFGKCQERVSSMQQQEMNL